jgi:hypothetical protein
MRIPRNSSSSFKFGTLQFEETAWVDKLLRKWDLAQLPNDHEKLVSRHDKHVDDENSRRDRSQRTNDHPVVDAQCVQAIIDGLRASSDKSRSTRYLYDKAKALSDTERPKTPEAMIDWVVTTMRNVKVALETANLNGFVYDASFQLVSVSWCSTKF